MRRLSEGSSPDITTVPPDYPPNPNFQADQHRPLYHFLPEANWLNDPNGVIQWQDEYHLFYQHNPNGAFHNTIHWGHAVSRDLVHWEHLPVALTPTPGTADADGCWSGYTVNNQGVPTIIYTGIRNRVQLPCLATSPDNLRTWHKYEGNPIIATPPQNLDVTGFRDHCVWQDKNGLWYQIIGTGFKPGGGAALLYRSPDLLQWEYLHPLYSGDFEKTGIVWECPDFFQLDEKFVLFISSTVDRQVVYYVGDYVNQKFQPSQNARRFDHGGYSYAHQSLRDSTGRRIVWSWIREGRGIPAQKAAGWSGLMSLPLVLSWQPNQNLGIAFAPELQALRGEHYHLNNLELSSDLPLEEIKGDCLEIEVEVEFLEEAGEFGITLRASPDDREQTRISYQTGPHQLIMDCSQSSLDTEVNNEIRQAEHRLAPGESLKLHLFLDRSVIEMCANNQTYMTARVYPTRADSLGLRLSARQGRLKIKSLDIWTLHPTT